MTTQSFSARYRHDDNTTWQEWATDLFNKLVACGLTQTADTGQLAAPVVATRPGIGADGGYWIFAFSDSLQGTAPIYMKVTVGTGAGSTTSPRIKLQVGTGTNGSGTLTGTALTNTNLTHGGGTQTTDTARPSYLCHTAGFFGMFWKVGASSSEAFFAVARTVDSSGTPTATGAIVLWGASTTNNLGFTQALRFASTAIAYTEQNAQTNMALGLSPQARTNSAVGGDIQAFLGYTIAPQATPLLGVCGVYDSEVAAGATFSATLVGASAHTYIGLGTAAPFGPFGSTVTGGLKFAMLWE